MLRPDLRHWRAVEELTLEQAAQLIAGLDPSSPVSASPDDLARAKTYAVAITQAARRAWQFAHSYMHDLDQEKDPQLPDIWEMSDSYERYLPSIELRQSVSKVLQDPENIALIRPADPFYSETVYAAEMQRWIEANEVDSLYAFQGSQYVVVAPRDMRRVIEWQEEQEEELGLDSPGSPSKEKLGVGAWPWGEHETVLLRMMGAAAKKFWTLYDASDPSTAPKNAQVVAWLRSEGVAERTAEVMATILRADGLPTGPR